MTLIVVGFGALTLALVAIVVRSVATLARRAGFAPRGVASISVGVLGALLAWLSAVLVLSQEGFFERLESFPPRIPLTTLVAVFAVVALSRTRTFVQLAEVMPVWWPIALQAFRVPVELLLWALYEHRAIPVHMTFEGRNFDVLVGVTAPIVAYAVHRGGLRAAGVIAWNVASLGVLANIVVMAITSLPGPLHARWEGVAPLVIARPPFIWLPSFLVPLAIVCHVQSLRKVRYAAVHAGAHEKS